jgi:hypothetical protein
LGNWNWKGKGKGKIGEEVRVSDGSLVGRSRKLTEYRTRTEIEKMEEGQEDCDLGVDRWRPSRPEGFGEWDGEDW